jgi:hypothetical protein
VPALTQTPFPTRPPTSTPTPTPTFTPSPTPTPPGIVLAGQELPIHDLDLAAEGRIEITLGQLGSGTQNLSRENPEALYTLGIPGNLEIVDEGSYITLITSHFPALPDKPSALEVEVNGRLLSAIALTEENAVDHETRIDLPADLLDRQVNTILVRLETGATCDDPGAILKVVVQGYSTLSFGFHQTGYPTNLSSFPLPFAEQSFLSVPVTLVLPDSPSEPQLAAAATLAASLGKATQGQVDLHAILASAFDKSYADHHLILIGGPGEHALLDALDPPAAVAHITLDPNQGYLEERTSPWNKYRVLLIVAGQSDSGMTHASRALAYRFYASSIRGSQTRVDPVDPPAGDPGALPAEQHTLASLGGGGDVTFYGTRRQERSYSFTLPPGWKITGPSELTLHFTHASTLDPEQSVLDVRLNDQPVGSAFLDTSNANEGEWTLSLPPRVLQDGENQLTIGVEMTLPGSNEADRCRLSDDARLWTVLYQNSRVSVPYEVGDPRPALEHLPYPFAQDSGLSQTLWVMPNGYDAALADDLVRLVARFGAAVETDHLSANVLVADDVKQDDWLGYNIVLLGRLAQNSLLSEFNDRLPWRFVEGGDALTDTSKGEPGLQLELGEDASVGLIQIIPSPWNKVYALMAVTGTSDDGVHLAVQTLLNADQALRGNLVVIEAPPTGARRIQSTDTRPAQADEPDTPGGSDSGETPAIPTMSDSDKTLLAEYWWK